MKLKEEEGFSQVYDEIVRLQLVASDGTKEELTARTPKPYYV